MQRERLRSAVSQIAWYAKRPDLYSDLARRIALIPTQAFSTSQDTSENRRASEAWCRDNQQTVEELARELDIDRPLVSVKEKFGREWAYALQAQSQCPVPMGGPGYIDLLYALSIKIRAQKILETGVAYGWSSLAFLLALDEVGQGKLVSIDRPYPLMDNDQYVGCVVPEHLYRHWLLIRKADRDGLPQALKHLEKVDLVHYDSDKSFSGRSFAYCLLWARLRPGGILISDDIGDNLAFKRFSDDLSRQRFILEKDGRYIGIIVK